jgi:hypothetical protein
VNGKMTTASKDPSPSDAGIRVVGKSSPSSLRSPSTIVTMTIAKEKKGGDEWAPREDQENEDNAPSRPLATSPQRGMRGRTRSTGSGPPRRWRCER